MGADVVLDARRPQPWVGDCSKGRHPRGLRQGHLRRWAHAWIYDTMVRSAHGGTLGTGVVAIAGGAAQEAGFEWLHVDLDDHRRRLHASRHPTRA